MTTLSTLCGTGNLKCWTETGEECKIIFTARKRSLRRLYFHRCLPHCMLDIPPRQVHPLPGTPPWADTPGQVHPQGRNPLPSACWDTPPAQCMLGYTPCAVHAGMRLTSGRYASHWNAFLLKVLWSCFTYKFKFQKRHLLCRMSCPKVRCFAERPLLKYD